MTLLIKNSLPAERSRGLNFVERFRNNAEVAKQSYNIGGTLTIENGIATFNGTDTIVEYNTVHRVRTVMFEVKATSDTEDIVSLNSSQSVEFNAGSVSATGFTSATSYVDGTAGTTVTAGTWHHIVVTDTVDIVANDLKIGYISGFGDFEIKEVKLFANALTADEVADYYNKTTFSYENDCVLDLPMTFETYDPTNGLCLDTSGTGRNLTLGDGSTVSTFPVKKTEKKGYTFSSGSSQKMSGASLPIGGSTAFTLELNITFGSDVATVQRVFYQDATLGGSGSPVLIGYVNSGTFVFYLVTGGADTLSTNIVSNGSYHFVFTYDSTNMNIYKNGCLITQVHGTAGAVAASTGEIVLGGRLSAANYDGDINSFRAYANTALTPIQAKDLYLKAMKSINRV